MGELRTRLTVFFEDPFWVGVFERVEDGRLSAAKIVFGAEPKDSEVYEFVLKNYPKLHFSPFVATEAKGEIKNPKREQREIKRSVSSNGTGTKSMQALKLQQEQSKLERKEKSREKKKADEKLLFEKKQQKKKEKRRGR